jgi:hypothetical protein
MPIKNTFNSTRVPVTFLRWIAILLCIGFVLVLAWLGVAFWQWAWYSVNTKPAVQRITTQQQHENLEVTTTLSEDEKTLLLLRSSAFLALLQQQDYGALYDTWAGDAFKKTGRNRSVFLKMAYCSERFLGKLVTYNNSTMVVVKVVKPSVAYHVVFHAEHEKTNTLEKLVLLPYGMDYRWGGYFISTPNPSFHVCLNTISHPRTTKTTED